MEQFYFKEGERELLLRLRTLFGSGKRGRAEKVLIERSKDGYKLSSLTPKGKIRADQLHE